MSRAQRRWPPIVAAVIGAILVFLVLPNPLSIPQTNPSASAEYAPVPGDQQTAQTANFSSTQGATSAGVGAGGEGIGALPGIPPPKLPEFNPRHKNCVGNPPRQTEDPLSPPCVPFFEGKNGGATAPGVTKDEIVVIYYNDRCCSGDLTKPWKPSDEGDCNGPAYECENIVRTVKAQYRYFANRYQTYDRTVRLIGYESSGNISSTCAEREQDAKTIMEQHTPFAIVLNVAANIECFMKLMAKNQIPSFGANFDVPERQYQELRPYSYGFFPSQEVEIAWSASFICRKLVGNTAEHAGDAAYHDMKRKIGFIRPDGESRGPELPRQAELLEKELKRQCGYEFHEQRSYKANVQAGAGGQEAAGILSYFKQQDVTTVVCYCIPVQTELTVPTMQKTATSLNYYPEWYWDPASAMDRPVWLQTHGSAEQVSFGTTYFWVNPAFREQFHYQAYLESEPGTQPNVRGNFTVYHLFLNLFQGLQAAGPNLTPASIEQGMFTFNWTDFRNPRVPVGGYGPYGPNAVSDYTFVDSAMAWWWDPNGTPPGGKNGEGCQRPVNRGLRHYEGQWPKGDDDLFQQTDPCHEDNRKLADPSASGSV